MEREIRRASHSRADASTWKALAPELQGQAQLFFSLYFAMTGLHALHMVIGAGIMFVLTSQARKGKFTAGLHDAGRHRRALLALRRHHLDFPVPAAVPDRPALGEIAMSEHVDSAKTYVAGVCWG